MLELEPTGDGLDVQSGRRIKYDSPGLRLTPQGGWGANSGDREGWGREGWGEDSDPSRYSSGSDIMAGPLVVSLLLVPQLLSLHVVQQMGPLLPHAAPKKESFKYPASFLGASSCPIYCSHLTSQQAFGFLRLKPQQ